MKAVTFPEYKLESLQVREIPLPNDPNEREVRIKVSCASLNPVDKYRVNGAIKFLVPDPVHHVLGYDVSGVIDMVGSAVTEYKVGDRVCARLVKMSFGAFAEYVTTPIDFIAKVPDNVTLDQAAAVPLAGQTALQMIYRAQVSEKSKVLITGGAGGVGSFLVGLCKHVFKAEKVDTTASGIGIDLCKKLGADEVFDYKVTPLSSLKPAYDILFDCTKEAKQMVGAGFPNAQLISVSALPTVHEVVAKSKDANAFVRYFVLPLALGIPTLLYKFATRRVQYSYLLLEPNHEDLDFLMKAVGDNKIHVAIDSVTAGIENFKIATDKSFGGRAKGKVILQIGDL